MTTFPAEQRPTCPKWQVGGRERPGRRAGASRRALTCCLSADHLDHIKKVAGAGAVGLGGDYDGVSR